MAIALNMPYKQARKTIKDFAARGHQGNKAIAGGVFKDDLDAALQSMGWVWHKAPVLQGRKARYSDIPGVAIVRMSRHFAAVINGELHDSFDSSDKMVYGYWAKV